MCPYESMEKKPISASNKKNIVQALKMKACRIPQYCVLMLGWVCTTQGGILQYLPVSANSL